MASASNITAAATDAAAVGDGPVTVAVMWHIRPSREAAFSEWISGVTAAALRFPGHLGINVMRPSRAGQPFGLIFRFASYADRRVWEQSPERATWIAQALLLHARDPEVQTISGLEYWFTLPDSRTPPPPRWKMAGPLPAGESARTPLGAAPGRPRA